MYFWRRHSLFESPVMATKPFFEGAAFYSKNTRPFGDMMSSIIKSYIVVVSAIRGLLFARCPKTVRWAIVPVNISSLDRMFIGRSLTNIFEKARKIIPIFTDFNVSCTIIFVANMIWVNATLLHTCPNNIFRGYLSLLSRTVLNIHRFYTVIKEASATPCVAITERMRINLCSFTTITLTNPETFFGRGSFYRFNSDKSTESYVRNINFCWHNYGNIISYGGVRQWL